MNEPHAASPLDRWDVDPIHEGHRATNIVLNAPFVRDVGQETADQMVAILNDVGAHLSHHGPAEVAAELRRRLRGIGVHPPEPELARMADEISRFDTTEAHLGPAGG